MNQKTLMTLLICAGAVVSGTTAERMSQWNDEYQQIRQEIQDHHQGLAKHGAGYGPWVVHSEPKILDRHSLIQDSDRSPLDVAIRRIGALLNHLRSQSKPPKGIEELSARFDRIRNRYSAGTMRGPSGLSSPDVKMSPFTIGGRLSIVNESVVHRGSRPEGLAKTSATADSELEIYMALRKIQRQAQFSNPLLQDIDDILFIGHMVPNGPDHMCFQYYGWNARNGGGLYILRNFKSDNPTLVNVLENSTVQNGRLAGRKLTGGAFLSPDLSYDGKTILFAWTSEEEKCWHIFKVNTDGSNLIQLTDGSTFEDGHEAPWTHLAYANHSQNDFDPCFLPNGRIAFVSERRGGYLRCSAGMPAPTFTLFSMKDDGSDMIPISYHETNEWHPSVNNDGMIVYTRWDYIDRDDCIAHHMWTCYPDGRDPRAPHGNYPLPYDTFDEPGYVFPMIGCGSFTEVDGRRARPNGEWSIRAIPGSQKYIAVVSGHHRRSYGQLVMIDPTIEDNNAMSQLTGITDGRTDWGEIRGPYAGPWPLSEDFYLVGHNNEIVLLDRFRNREVIYKATSLSPDSSLWPDRLIDPIPLVPRDPPPVIPAQTHQGENLKPDSPDATISVMNVKISDVPLPDDVTIKWLRVVQIIPQLQSAMNNPAMGYASESLARLSLGVVPVEPDGSVYFKAPVAKEIYFQLLDEKGMAVQSMRSGTYVHPGEQMSCVGCHENKWESIPVSSNPLAMQRPPSELMREVSSPGAVPFNWHLLVKPVLQEKCGNCHGPDETPPDLSYWSLEPYTYYVPYWDQNCRIEQGNRPMALYVNGEIKASGSRTRPGRFGAQESRLYKDGYLSSSHYNVNLTSEELRRITMWLDLNSNELGAYRDVEAQRQGEVVWPGLDMDPENPTGVENRNTVSVENRFHTGTLQAKSNGDRVTVSVPRKGTYRLSIGDLSGKLVYADLISRADQVSLSVRTFSPGIYVIRAYNKKSVYIGKLVLMR